MDYTYLTSLKNDFHAQLLPILSSSIYYQLKGMYSYSEQIHPKLQKKKNLSFEKVFKTVLSGFENLNNHEIEKQYYTVKMNSKCSDFFDNLVIASFKSYILFVTWDPKTQVSKFTNNEYFKNILVKDFIHKCHIVSADYFKNHIDLFASKNKKDIIDIISSCIKIAMIKMIPYNEMLNEYIENNFAVNISETNNQINEIRNKVNNFIASGKYRNISLNNKNNDYKQNIYYSENDENDNGNDINEFINSREQNKINLQNFSANINNRNISALDDGIDSDVSTIMSREDQKNKELDNLIGNNNHTQSEVVNNELNENINNNIVDMNNKEEEEEEEYNNEEDDNKVILTSPPALKSKNKLLDLGAKNKLVIVSNKKTKSNRINEMDDYYNQQLK
jgi:hypothetical protein